MTQKSEFNHSAEQNIFDFFRRVQINHLLFLLAGFCSFLGVLFNLSGLQLLIPLAQGIIQNNYSHIHDHLGLIDGAGRIFPGLFHNPHLAFFPLAGIVLGLILIQNLLDYASALIVATQTKKAESKLRQLLFSRHLSFGKLYFDKHSSPDIHNTIMAHASTAARQLKSYHRIFSQCLSLTAIFGLLLFISWRLTLSTLIILPLFVILSQWAVKKLKNAVRAREAFLGQIRHRIFNIIACIPLVKISAAEKEEETLFQEESSLEAQYSLEVEKKTLLIKPVEDISTFITLILIAAVMSFIRLQEQSTDVSSYLVFFYIVQQALTRLSVFNEFKVNQANAHLALRELSKVLSDRDKFAVPGGVIPFTGLKQNLQIKNLHFAYHGQKQVLKGINLNIEKGKMTAIVGPSGAGKTTLFSLLLRLYDCPAQSVLIDGADIRGFNIPSLMEYMAYVSQDILLFNHTLRFNLLYGLKRKVSDDELWQAVKIARLDQFIKNLPQGFDTFIGERGVRLSGGEKQRTSIARALLKKADILFLDEATSSLDSLTEKQVQAAIGEATLEKTTLVIAHRLSTILHADKIILLHDGVIREEGSLKELIDRKGEFFEHWKAQKFDDLLNQIKT